MTSNEDELTWPKALPDLEELDSLLRCGICYDYINTALMTPCSHNFCSICIRKYMLYKTNCPSCFADTVESQLKFNRTLDNIIVIIKRLKAPLNKAIKENIPSNKQTVKPVEEVKIPKISVKTVQELNNSHVDSIIQNKSVISSPCRTPFITEQNSSFIDSCVTPKNPDRHVSVLSYAPPSPKVSSPMTSPTSSEVTQKSRSVVQMLMSPVKKPGVSLLFTPTSPQAKPNTQATTSRQSTQASTSTQAATTVTKVPCPVCNVDIPERNINLHLDACLKNQGRAPEVKKFQSNNANGRRPLPKLVYHVLPERELKRKLSDLKLSTQGDRKTLEKRHQRYTVLYNSECDKEKQRPLTELVKQVEKEEKEESRANCRTLTALQVDRKADPKVIDAAQKKYMKENKSSFDSLIAQLQARRAANKAKKSGASTAGPSSCKSDDSSDQPEIIDDDSSVSNTDLLSPKQSTKHSINPSPGVSSTSRIESPTRSESNSSPCKINDSDPETYYSPDTSDNSQDLLDTSVKSPILGKRRVFQPRKKSQVIEISDDEEESANTDFSPGDLEEIDALVQQSQVPINISPSKVQVSREVCPNKVPEIVTNNVPFESINGANSDDSSDAFQVPKKKSKTPLRNTEEVSKKTRKRDIPSEINNTEPRRSTRKKAKY